MQYQDMSILRLFHFVFRSCNSPEYSFYLVKYTLVMTRPFISKWEMFCTSKTIKYFIYSF